MIVMTGTDLPENSRIAKWQSSGVISCNQYSTSKIIVQKNMT